MDNDRFLIYSSALVIMGLSNAVIPVLPELSATGQIYGINSSSLLYSSFFLGALSTLLPFGILSDRTDNLKLISLGLLLSFISGLWMIFTDNFMIFISARFIEGVACGAFFPAAYSRLAGCTERARYMGEFSFLINAGLAAGVAVTGYLVHTNIKNGIILFSILIFFTMIFAIYLFMVPSRTMGKIELQKKVSKREHSKSHIFTSKDTRGIWIISFILAGSSGVLISLYPEYGIDTLSKTELGISISLLYVSTMISSLLASYMDTGHAKLIKRGILMATVGIVVTIYSPMLGFFIIGTGTGLMLVGLPIAIASMKVEKGIAMGVYNTCIYAGLALMPLMAGALAKSIEIKTIFFMTAILFGLTIFLSKD
ncbi:MFS transporter [Methanococcoides seepicolus]|uniref:MFS transporter n=1 Tax=Methanococcoides seepicolus TaxID=2828780 RepID=A0A9E5DAG1_9EURY|nr:MFS transporter [Methanococcoides seepicolus]MCM1985932.1 MFS transporter [Methanococcoides seepicolus]MCM1986563.1 MFS transporter [Methanococcoides seepicolus]